VFNPPTADQEPQTVASSSEKQIPGTDFNSGGYRMLNYTDPNFAGFTNSKTSSAQKRRQGY